MFRLYGFFTQNTMKTLYVLEAIGTEYEFVYVDLSRGEQKSESFQKKTAIGKVPLLEHDGEHLFESGAICRYVANATNSPLYPDDKLRRARVDQWMDFFSCHLGRWFTTMYFEGVIKPKFGLGDSDERSVEESRKIAHQQLSVLNAHLEHSKWLANDTMSIADLFAFAYLEQYRDVDFPLGDYDNVQSWFERVESIDSIAGARARLPS